MKPWIPSSEDFSGVWFVEDNQPYDTSCWSVALFEGKTKNIPIRIYGETSDIQTITGISLNPAQSVNFLNPRPATGSLPYPWRYNDETVGHIIKLPVQLTYNELIEGSQIAVSGVTEAVNVVAGAVESNVITFRAGGLTIAQIMPYEGSSDLVTLVIMEGFTGNILAVNFNKSYKNLFNLGGGLNFVEGRYYYFDSQGNKVASCLLNGYCIGENPVKVQPDSPTGNESMIFDTFYVENIGDAIDSTIAFSGRDLYLIRVIDGYTIEALRLDLESGGFIYPEI